VPKHSESEEHLSARAVLARNVVALRTRKGLSQEELAAAAGMHRTYVLKVEKQITNIALDNLERLARALGVPPYALLHPSC
jgi:transcriptional regulator with XRE-family HTH domain